MSIVLFALLSNPLIQQDTHANYTHNNIIPSTIEKHAVIALARYPELKDTRIEFVYTRKLKSSVMAARPVIGSLFRKKEKRVYQILINPVFKLEHSFETIRQIPDSVLIGWIGHELGHIMDYEERSTLRVMGFGLSYWLSKKYIRKAERVADSFAVDRGLGEYLVATKSFILDHTELPQPYKDKIASLYLSPDDIMELVTELEGEEDGEKAELLAEEEEVVNEAETELRREQQRKTTRQEPRGGRASR